MSDINKKGIWNTSIFHELYGMNITQNIISPYNYDLYSYIPSTTINSCINPYLIKHSDFELGEKMRIILKIQYEELDPSNTSGTFKMWFQGAKKNPDGSNVWTGGNDVTGALNNYQNLTDVVLSQEQGSFIYNTTFIISENNYNTYTGCNIGIRSDYSNGIGKITMYKPIIFPDKYYYLETDSIIRQGDDFLSCKEIVEY